VVTAAIGGAMRAAAMPAKTCGLMWAAAIARMIACGACGRGAGSPHPPRLHREPWRRPEGAFKTYRDAVGNYEPSGRKKKRQEQLYCTTATSYKPAWRGVSV